ncbi:hypothetical protein GSI_01999 [Ganoderma sinense ZZ0214-1]|uniref:Uncharacterized protein n=1 Tax=Ganoderma sinense ZZ0214-1 TaxID=1077348 RepID=A0A2G8SNC9_9APHY|nr:hypothetical protein GSI_01999 [Ganoderma sinense ZZ0214-1]
MAERELPRADDEARPAVRDDPGCDGREGEPIAHQCAQDAAAPADGDRDDRPENRSAESRRQSGLDDLLRLLWQVDDGDRRRAGMPSRDGLVSCPLARMAGDQACEVAGERERRPRVHGDELRAGLAVELEEARRVVVAAREEAVPEARVRELAVLLCDLVGAGGVVPPAPAAVGDEVDGRHARDGALAAEETGDTGGVERELCIGEWLRDDG